MTENILVVEDDPELTKMWVYLLQRYGYVVHTAHNISRGLTVYQQQPVSMILVDQYLPGGRGTDLLARIHALSGQSRPVSVLLTSTPYFKPEAYDNLVDAFLLKPVYPQQIMSLVWRYLPPVAS